MDLTPPSKNWMTTDILSDEYIKGVESFVIFAKRNSGGVDWYSCPCARCRNVRGKKILSTVSEHLIMNGIDQTYTTWFFHGEQLPNMGVNAGAPSTSATNCNEELLPIMVDLVNDTFGRLQPDDLDACMNVVNEEHGSQPQDDIDNDSQYNKLREDTIQPLYPSCKHEHTKLSVTVELMSIKARYQWSDDSFTSLLQLLKKILPSENSLPDSTYNAKRLVSSLRTQTHYETAESILSIAGSDPSSNHKDSGHDPVSQVCGCDSKGRVRGIGFGISKTTMKVAAPYIVEARPEKNAHMSIEAKFEATMTQMQEFRTIVEQQFTELRQQITHQSQLVHRSLNTAASQAHRRSNEPLSRIREDSTTSLLMEQICQLRDIRGRTIASGRMVSDNTGIPPECVRVVIDHINIRATELFNDNRTFEDIRLGEIVVWPKFFMRI